MIYGVARTVFVTALEIFYRWQHLGGAIPAEGPLVVVGNHPNGLVDPIAVMRLTQRPVRFLAKAPIFKMPVLGALVRGMQCLPVYRKQDDPAQVGKNDETFAAAHAALLAGQSICIFPEGKSHSEPALEPLKTGAARIALGAEAQANFGAGVRFVPVGLVFRDKGIFRSQAAVEVGEPVPAAAVREAYAADPVAAAQQLTDLLDAALRRVTVNLTTWEDLPLLEQAAAIYQAERGTQAPLRPFADGLAALRERAPEELAAARARVAAFARQLQRLGLRAAELDAVGPGAALRFALRQAGRVLLGLPLALLGALAYALPYQAIRLLVALRRDEPDLLATVKVLAGLVFFPLWAALLGGLGWAWGGWVGLLLGGPGLAGCALWSLRFFEGGAEAWQDTRAFLLLLPHGAARRRLLARRKALCEELDALGQRAGVLPVTSANG